MADSKRYSFFEIVLGALLATAGWVVVAIFGGAPAELLKDLATPAATLIAAAVAASVARRFNDRQLEVAKLQAEVAVRSWRTSNEKIILDLFDRRISIYESIRAAIAPVMTNGRTTIENLQAFDEAIDKVRFFFGPEVSVYCDELRRALISHRQVGEMFKHDPPNYEVLADREATAFTKIVGFYAEAPPLFAPYIQAHQRTTDQIVAAS